MRLRRLLIAAFSLTVLFQISVPAWRAIGYERALRHGRAFKVRCLPVDPADAFRGRYVALRLDLPTAPIPGATVAFDPAEMSAVAAPPAGEGAEARTILPPFGSRVWAVLEVGPDGFARAARLSASRPPDAAAVRVVLQGYRDEPGPPPGAPSEPGPDENRPRGRSVVERGIFDLGLPNDRYYMTEALAPEAEKAYREALSAAAPNRIQAWVVLKVLDGIAAIESLQLDGLPVEEYLARHPAPAP